MNHAIFGRTSSVSIRQFCFLAFTADIDRRDAVGLGHVETSGVNGGAAALAGVIAAHTTLPVIGIPIESSSLKGLDSLLSTVQMPAGIPVASMAIGSAGAKNAAIFALEILGSSDKKIASELLRYRQEMKDKITRIKIKL